MIYFTVYSEQNDHFARPIRSVVTDKRSDFLLTVPDGGALQVGGKQSVLCFHCPLPRLRLAYRPERASINRCSFRLVYYFARTISSDHREGIKAVGYRNFLMRGKADALRCCSR